jgi:hypothetical protein
MSNKYTTNKNALADCDVCGFQYKLKTLKSLFVRKTKTNILACTGVLEPRSTAEHARDVPGRRPTSGT